MLLLLRQEELQQGSLLILVAGGDGRFDGIRTRHWQVKTVIVRRE